MSIGQLGCRRRTLDPTDLAQIERKRVNALVTSAYDALRDLVGSAFVPGYFNFGNVLAAEENGLSVLNGVLGHVLSSSLSEEQEAKARILVERVSGALVQSEVENRCHNLHGACALMLDALGIPVIQVWGSVYATDEAGRTFWINRLVHPDFEGHNPGHSWLLTPSWRVVDLALMHQYAVAGNYEDMRDSLRRIIVASSNETFEPDVTWWRFEDGRRLGAEGFAKATQYHELIGWTQIELGATTVRYLPSAVTLPSESEMGDVNIKIGGLSPRQFFDENASDLLERV